MTNETVPHDNGAADPAVHLTAIAAAETTAVTEPAPPPEPTFEDLGLHPDVKLALDDMGYFRPTPVQTAVYGPVSAGKDLMVQSRTGTGKTAAFGLPIISKIVPTHRAPQALILAPTRELALQVARELTQLGKHRGILVEPIYGGAPIGKQITALRDGVHIIVGTPGRVLDHIGRRTLDCKTVTTFVLDECDEMLSMGFLEDIERVVSHLPEKKQTLLFSATMPDEVTRYARRQMVAPEQLSLSRDSISVAEIHHAYYIVSGIARSRDLLKVIFAEEPERAIIFCNTRDETTMVAKFLQKQGLDAEPLSSDLSQSDRERVMGRMKRHDLRLLCSTDVAARGIDISDLSHVINYSVPESPEIYVHRTGRTGRAGKRGTALSLVGPRELGNFRYVRLQFGIKPEERLLPKDDVFEGRLKVPLPPVGTPQPPDPIQLLIRGVTGTASELERSIFEKLLGTQNGKRVLAKLVAERLDQLSTRSRPKRVERDRDRDRDHRDGEHAAAGGEVEAAHPDGERTRERDDRPRRSDRDRDRPRDDRPRRFDGERGDRERGGRDRPFGERDRDRGERRMDRDRDDRPRDRDDQPRDRDDRPRDRDRGERRDHRHEEPAAAQPVAAVTAAPVGDTAASGETSASIELAPVPPPREEHREHRDRDREPRDREPRNRDRGPREHKPHRDEAPVEAAPVAEPAVEAGEGPGVEDVARAALERADRAETRAGERKRGRDRKTEPTAETREFWETWAESKSTRADEPATPAAEPPPDAADTVEARPSRRDGERGGRGRDRGRGDKRERGAKPEREPREASKHEPRSRKEATPSTPAAAAENGAQTRLFVSLGKKHGVTADDLRTLLAGPIGGDTARIGSVSLRDSHAHVRVPEEHVEAIIAGVNGTTHAEQSVTVERSRG